MNAKDNKNKKEESEEEEEVEEEEEEEEEEPSKNEESKEEDAEEEAEDEEDEEEEEDDDELVDLDFDADDNIGDFGLDAVNNDIMQTQQTDHLGTEEHRYDHIKDPHVKMLMTMNLESSTKDDVVNLLLGNKALGPKEIPKNKKKGKINYNVKSHYNLENLYAPTHAAKTFHIDGTKDNPEFTNDFGTAVKRLLNKMSQDSNNQELLKILISDKDKLNAEIGKLEIVKREYIHNKVNTYISKRQQNLENIQGKLNEEHKMKCTFNPELMMNDPKNPNNKEKRNWEQFLNDQNNHNKRIEDKIKIAKEDNKKKEDKKLKESHPKIDEHSEKIFQEKFKTEEPSHLRLYKKRYQTTKKEILKTKEENKIAGSGDKIKSGKKKKNRVDDFLEKKEKDKKPISKKEADEHTANLYKSHVAHKNRMEELKNKIVAEEEKGKEGNKSGQKSNKFFLKKVMEKYRKIITNFFSALIASTENTAQNTIMENNHENENEKEEGLNIHQNENENEIKLNNIKLNRISLLQIGEVLHKFGFTEFLIEKNKNYENNEGTGEFLSNEKSQHKMTEKKLIYDLWEVLKDNDGYVNVDHLFMFVLAVINLYEYYLYISYKKTNATEEIKNEDGTVKVKKTTDQDKEEILSKISNDINSKIVTNTKYGGFDESHNFLISFEKAKLINKDFNIFYINYMNRKVIKSEKQKDQSPEVSLNATFTPQINEHSNKLYTEYRRKIIDLNNSNNETLNSRREKEKDILDYIDKLILKKKRKENTNKQLKEEFANREMENCTFSPKINNDYHDNREGVQIDDKQKKWDKLHKMGTQMRLNKKDKLRDVLDHEMNKEHCTFEPNLNKEVKNIKDDGKITNDIYNETSYELLYNRLKNGRIERIIKNSVHERGDFPIEIEEYMSGIKKEINISPKERSFNNKKKSIQIRNEDISDSNPNNNRNNSNSYGNDTNEITEEVVENFNNEPDKKDAIPLLIIDVNIRPGVKKKIYVFDGDTSEGLADRFSKEHNLDGDTKAKLQILIQSHMSRLLMRIDEENQSVSEKSSTYNLS